MTSIKFKIKKSSVENKKASIYVQLIHRRKIRKIFTKQYVYQSEWDEGKGRIRYEMVARNDRRRFSELKGVEECLNQIYYELDSCIYNLSHGWLSDDYSLEDVMELYQGRKYCDMLLSYGEQCCEELKKQNRPRTAEAYLSTIRSVVKFNNGKDVALQQITRTFLKSYEIYLHKRGCQPNTISFYMRMLRAIYNKAVSDRIISMFVESPFQKVFTGMEKTRKRAVDKSVIRQLKNAAFPNEPTLDFARDLFLFSFYTRGMAFVDLAFLRKDSLKQGVLCYRRFKTGQRLRIKVTKPLAELIQKYAEATKEEPYLLPVVSSNLPDTRGQYKKALHNQNRRLKTISERLSIYPYLTSYSPRHSWATIAKKEGLEIPVISEGMGHQSMVTTEIYLAFFDDDVLDQANDLVIAL